MSACPAKIWVLVGERFACVKIDGRANFLSSVDFKTLLNELRERGYGYFVLDLSDCALMDSTFLGTLAGFGMQMRINKDGEVLPAIELFNPNKRVTELLENLGVLHLFKVTHGPLTPPEGIETREHTPGNPPKEAVTRACLEAHQVLMDISPDNAGKFKELTQFLSENLNRLKKP